MSTMKQMSRVYLFGAVVLSALVLLTACGSDNKSTASSTKTPASGASRSAAASGSPRTSSSPAASGTGSPSASSSAAALEIKMVPTIKFNKTELTVDAGKDVTLTVNNTDTGVGHNFALYKTKADADAEKSEIASTKVCSGPCKETLDLNLTPGEYFFHCDVHPQLMTGTLNAK